MYKIIILQLARIGDIVQTLPAIYNLMCRNFNNEIASVVSLPRNDSHCEKLATKQSNLKQHFTDLEITFVGIKDYLEVVKSSKLIDRFVSITDLNNIEIKNELAEKYDLLINLTHDKIGDMVSKNIISDKKCGRIRSFENEFRLADDASKYFYAMSHKRKDNLFNICDIHILISNSINRNKSNNLMYRNFNNEITSVVLLPRNDSHCEELATKQSNLLDVSETDFAINLLTQSGFIKGNKLIALHMGANLLHRAWKPINFAILSNLLSSINNLQIILIGSQNEIPLSNEFKKHIKTPVVDLIGKTKLNELPQILKFCEILISCDSGPLHVASALNVKCIGLYFNTGYFAETAPYGENNIIFQTNLNCVPCKKFCNEDKCLNVLKPEYVFEITKKILDNVEIKNLDFVNINVYKTKFGSNGILNYFPLDTNININYLRASVLKILFEKMFNIPNDIEYVDYIKYNIDNKILDEIKINLNNLLLLYDNALIEIEGFVNTVNKNKYEIVKFQTYIQNTENQILTNFNEIISFFHAYEIMDMEHVNALQMTENIFIKYNKMKNIIKNMLDEINIFDKFQKCHN